MWILAGVHPLSLDTTTLHNVLDDAINATKDVFPMLSSMYNFDMLAFAPRGANPKDATPIETSMTILCKFVHDPVERQRCLECIRDWGARDCNAPVK